MKCPRTPPSDSLCLVASPKKNKAPQKVVAPPHQHAMLNDTMLQNVWLSKVD
jgi:hypothetical protein